MSRFAGWTAGGAALAWALGMAPSLFFAPEAAVGAEPFDVLGASILPADASTAMVVGSGLLHGLLAGVVFAIPTGWVAGARWSGSE